MWVQDMAKMILAVSVNFFADKSEAFFRQFLNLAHDKSIEVALYGKAYLSFNTDEHLKNHPNLLKGIREYIKSNQPNTIQDVGLVFISQAYQSAQPAKRKFILCDYNPIATLTWRESWNPLAHVKNALSRKWQASQNQSFSTNADYHGFNLVFFSLTDKENPNSFFSKLFSQLEDADVFERTAAPSLQVSAVSRDRQRTVLPKNGSYSADLTTPLLPTPGR